MADKPQNGQSLAIIAPDGKAYMIPSDQVAEALLHGGQPALRMEAPGGGQHWIPTSQAVEAQRRGARVVQQDGKEYAPGTEPVITGVNSAGQPQWGTGPKYLGRNAAGFPYYEAEKKGPGFLESAGNAIGGAISGLGHLLDPRSEAEQKAGGLPSGVTFDPILYPARVLGRMIEPQVEQGKQALSEARQAGFAGMTDPRNSHAQQAIGHGLAAVMPGVGPWAAGVADTISPQIAEGNYGGAAGTLAGNAAAAAVPEIVPRGARAALEASRGRLAEMQAPRAALDRPIAPGELSPSDRWRAANRMGVNLDRAQATNAPGPRMAKTMTEKSLGGGPQFEANNAKNVQALHEHAGNILEDAFPTTTSGWAGHPAGFNPMDRRAFGEKVQQTLAQHRATLADEPGQTAAAQALLDKIHPRQMTGEEFGAAAKEALNKHQKQTYMQAAEKLTDALGSKGAQVGMGDVQATADRILNEEFDYYRENPESLKLPGIRSSIEQILPKASPEMRQKWAGQFTPERAGRQAAPSTGPGVDFTPAASVSDQAPLQGRAGVNGHNGKATDLLTPSQTLPATYRLVEAKDLATSHNAQSFEPNPNYPAGVQERDYKGSKEAQNRVIEQTQKYKPAYTVNTNPDAVNGPPVITPDGTVLGGNSRAMSTQRLYAEGKADAYKQTMKQDAATYGLTPEQVDGMDQPVLVRQIPHPATVGEARRLGSELNKPATGALGGNEQAVSAGKNLKPETLRSIQNMLKPDESLRELMSRRGPDVLSLMEKDGVITARERPQFVDEQNGGLSDEGKTFFERAMLGSVIDDSRLMDFAPKSILNKLEGVLGSVPSFASRADEWNLLPALREAVAEHGIIQKNGSTVNMHLGQQSMFGPERSPVVDALVRTLDEKPSVVRQKFEQFAKDADQNLPGQSRMFGKANASDAFNNAFGSKISEEDYHNGNTGTAHNEPTQHAGQPSQAAAPGSDQGVSQRAAGDQTPGGAAGGSQTRSAATPAGSAAPAPVSTPANVAKLRSDLMDLYRSPEIVADKPRGWLKQMVASLDDSLTNPQNEAGMSPGQIQKFRAGNSQWQNMKSMYDDPQSPFFSILRNPEAKTVAGTLEKLKPAAARQFREAMNNVDQPDLVRQQQRQIAGHLLDPTDSGSFDLPGLKNRWSKMNKETASELLHPDHMVALGDLADKTTKKTIYDKPGSQLKKIAEAPDGTTAAQHIFTDSGKFLLTPEEAKTIGEADPALVPQLQRHAMERLFDPAGNGTVDLRNFANRWDRAQAEPLKSVLTPDQMTDLDKLASVSRTVNLPVNPSGTATVLQPAAEAGQLARAGSGLGLSTVGGITGAAVGGPVGVALGGAAGAVADTAGKAMVAHRLINPEATRAVMEHTPPAPAIPAAMNAVKGAAANIVPGALKAAPAAEQKDEGSETPAVKPAMDTTVQPQTGSERSTLAESGSQVNLGNPKPVQGQGADTKEMQITAPAGATHEVVHPDGKTVLGHVVDGEYVPLATAVQ